MAKPPAKKRPYDAMKDESSRAVTAMPYTEKKAKTPPPKKRAYDPVKDEPTSRPFKRGGKVIRKAEGGLSKILTPKRLRGRDGPSDTLAFAPKMDTEGLRGVPSVDASKVDTTPKSPSSSQTFSEAFRAARKDPDKPKTFTWRGKSYTTEMEGERRSSPTATPAKAPAKASALATPAPKAATPAPKAATPAPKTTSTPAKATSTPAKATAKAPEKKAAPLPIPRVSSQDMRTRFAPSNQTSFAATADRKKRNEAVAANARAAAKAAAEAKRNPPKSWREDDPYKMAKGGKVTKKRYV